MIAYRPSTMSLGSVVSACLALAACGSDGTVAPAPDTQQVGDDTSSTDTSTGDTPTGSETATDEVASTPSETLTDGSDSADDTPDVPVDTGPACKDQPNPWTPPTAPLPWRHADWAQNTMASGDANHRGQDVIVMKGAPQLLVGNFEYGFLDVEMVDETVDVWIQRIVPCGAWERLGDFRTSDRGQYDGQYGIEDHGGRVFFEIPEAQQLPVGRYPVRMVMMGDLSQAAFDLIVVEPGTQTIVSDIDGTLTVGDEELMLELLKDIFQETYQQQMYVDADKVMKTWSDKGYLLVFVTGRPDMLRPMTERWVEPRFPPAALHLTDTIAQAVPKDDGVGEYKRAFLEHLKAQGLDIVAVYGNATTDIYAYEKAGFPKNRTFIAGSHKGESGTVAIDTYTDHFMWSQNQPAATIPAPPAFGWW